MNKTAKTTKTTKKNIKTYENENLQIIYNVNNEIPIIKNNIKLLLKNIKSKTKYMTIINNLNIIKNINVKSIINFIKEFIKKQSITNIIKIFNLTQYGIYNKSIIKGGSLLNNSEYLMFCTLFKGFSGMNNEYLTNTAILEQYPTLFNIISNGNIDNSVTIYIPNILNYNVLNNGYNITQKISQSSEYKKTIYYKEYNKDIILGYEYPFLIQYDDGTLLNNYIQQQNMYIAGLNEKQKNIIADYVRPATYNLLKEFLTDYSPGYIQRYISNKKGCFTYELANSFCDYLEHFIHNGYINFPIQNINDIKEKAFDDDAHDIYNSISEDIWTQIILLYLNDLNTIILNAPKSTHEFIVYRGVKEDYIIPQEYNTLGIPVYKSNRIISVSIDYKAAKTFYDYGNNPNLKTLYRIAIPRGCSMLFVTPLAPIYYKYEMEFILPINQYFYASNNNWNRNISYNNYLNKNNICLFEEDRINSKDLILIPI